MKTKLLILNLAIFLFITGKINFVRAQEKEKTPGELKIEIKNIDPQKTLVIKADVPTSEVGPKMGEFYGKLFQYIGQNQIKAVGPPFAVYYSFDPKGNTVFEAGIPIENKVEVTGEIDYKEFEATKAASTLYTGPYEKMEPAYIALQKYLKDNNIKEKGTAWEVYLTDPSEEPDPNNYKTIIYFPVE